MSLFSWFRSKAAVIIPAAKPPFDETITWLREYGCADCDHNPIELYEGPSGGASTNVFCSNCGQGYNFTAMLNRAEKIGRNMHYCDNDLVKAHHALKEECDK